MGAVGPAVKGWLPAGARYCFSPEEVVASKGRGWCRAPLGWGENGAGEEGCRCVAAGNVTRWLP